MKGYMDGYTVIQNKLITAPISHGAYRLGSYTIYLLWGQARMFSISKNFIRSIKQKC